MLLLHFLSIPISKILFYLKIKIRFAGNAPKLHGNWIAKYNEPNERGYTEEVTEEIEIRQFCDHVYCIGTTKDDFKRTFIYEGSIKRNCLYGHYRRKGTSQLGGKGVFQLKISSDDKIMKGYCMWYDKDTDEVESSKYIWEKISNGRISAN